MSNTVKWGVIGAGGIAFRRTIPEGIMPAKNAELIAVMDVDPQKAKEAGEKFGVPHYTTLMDLLVEPGLEAVYIATPVHLHMHQAITAIQHGKHVLCEKPLALNMDECLSIMDAAQAVGVKLGVGLMMRFHECHRAMKQVIESGRIGRPVMARAQLTCWYPRIEGAWRQDPKLGGGGALMDLGVHTVDLLRYLLGEVKEVTGFAESVVQDYPVDDSSIIVLKFESGAQGVVESFFNIPDSAAQNALEIYGTKGCVLTKGTLGQGSEGRFTIYSSTEDRSYDADQTREAGGMAVLEVCPDPSNIYQAEIEAFSSSVLNNHEPPIGAEDGIRSLEIVLEAYKSSRQGRGCRS